MSVCLSVCSSVRLTQGRALSSARPAWPPPPWRRTPRSQGTYSRRGPAGCSKLVKSPSKRRATSMTTRMKPADICQIPATIQTGEIVRQAEIPNSIETGRQDWGRWESTLSMSLNLFGSWCTFDVLFHLTNVTLLAFKFTFDAVLQSWCVCALWQN